MDCEINNFSNRIYPSKEELVDKLKNMRCDGGIMLEPRLQEYLKKKKYYKQNNIEPCISLEREFQISHRDKRALRAFLRGNKNIYTDKRFGFDSKRRNSKIDRKKYFPSKAFRDGDE